MLTSLHVTLAEVREQIDEMIGRGASAPGGHIPFTPRAKKVLELALREALTLGHNYIGTEHILLALIREKDGVAWKALEQLGLKPKATREAVISFLGGGGVVLKAEDAPGVEERLARLERLVAEKGRERDE